MSQIFLSYAWGPQENNKERARIVKDFLEKNGHYVFYDMQNQPAGVNINESITEAMRESDFALIIFTQGFFDKAEDGSEPWRLLELELAKEQELTLIERSPKDKFIIPICVSPENWVPELLGKEIDPYIKKLFIERTKDSRVIVKLDDVLENITQKLLQILPTLDINKPSPRPPHGRTLKAHEEFCTNFVRDNLSYFHNDDEYTAAKKKLIQWRIQHPTDFSILYETRFREHRNGTTDDPEILTIDNARRYIYRKFYAVIRDIEGRNVPVSLLRHWWGESDVMVWASVVFPLQVSLRRVLGSGATSPFLLFFAIFWPGLEKSFEDPSYKPFYNDPIHIVEKEELNRRLRYRLLRGTSDEQSKLQLG